MHLAFIDFVCAYDAARPESAAQLGGTTSAVCFLARELVKAGVSCTFFNPVRKKQQAHGISTLPLQTLGEEITRGVYDAYIFCGRWTAELVDLVRAHTQAPLIAWAHESAFAPPLTPALDAFDGVVFVSAWQQKINQAAAKPRWRQTVIRNAMNPLFAGSFADDAGISQSRTTPPVLLFAGSFARGAFHIPPILDKVRASRQDFSVEMFCDTNPSRNAEQDAAYIAWLRGQANITHVGMVGQPELAQCMRRATILLAPNTWPETSCIALIESLASGLTAITTNRAALPETASGFARQIPVGSPDEPMRFDMPIDYHAFAEATLQALREYEQNPVETEARLRRQVEYFNAHYQWRQRVAAWIAYVESLR